MRSVCREKQHLHHVYLDIGRTSQFPSLFKHPESLSLLSLFPQNLRMQQPLARLYFLTVLEHLEAKKYKLSGLVSTANKVIERRASPATREVEAVVLCVELQAVIQVIIHGLATCLNPSKLRVGEVQMDNINR